MAQNLASSEDIPGTEQLVDINHDIDLSHAGSGKSDIVLLPQPSPCGSDPLAWSAFKKHYQLFLLALYACAFSMGENLLGAAWTTVSHDTGVTISNLNAGGALNYLLLGFANIFWIPAAMKIGRRSVFLATTLICFAAAIWAGFFHGLAQWMLTMILNGIGTSAYQAVIQLSVFDMFFVHQRGRALSCYLFGQQLGSILGLITGGSIADNMGWRWSQFIVAIIEACVLALLFFTFEETLFPRFLFAGPTVTNITPQSNAQVEKTIDGVGSKTPRISEGPCTTTAGGEGSIEFPKRTLLQRLKPWTYFPQDRTTYWSYFVRPFFLFRFPNVVIAGIIFAFGCTAGIVSFNTISEILTEPPYNWSTTATGLVFLAALIGNVLGWSTGVLADFVVIWLARRNEGVKEPEMRLWTLSISFVYAALGYFLYGWGDEHGMHWITIAFGIGCMISHQVSACSIATAYAMDCFPGISGELVVVLAICSSCINFAISESTHPFIDAVGYGWVFTFYGFCVLASMLAAVPLITFGKTCRRMCAPRYRNFLNERGEEVIVNRFAAH